jgi:hypothetical protein
MEVEPPSGVRRSGGLRVIRSSERLPEKAILQDEAIFRPTGLISNGLAGERTSVVAIIRVFSLVQTHYYSAETGSAAHTTLLRHIATFLG